MKIAKILFILLFFYYNINAQVFTKDRDRFINEILSDTIGNDQYYLTLKVKSSKSNIIYIHFDGPFYLYKYFKEKYNWSSTKFNKEMKKYLLYNKVFITDDEYFFDSRTITPLNECKYNSMSLDSLLYIFDHMSKNSRINCLAYELFNKNVFLMQVESDIKIGASLEEREKRANQHSPINK